MTMAWLRNKYLAGVIVSSLLISCSGSAPKSEISSSNADAPVSQSSNRPHSSQPEPNASPQPSASPKVITKSTTSQDQAAKKPPASLSPAPKIKLSASEKKLVTKVHKEVKKKGTIAKQDSGQTYLDNILQSQQALKLVNGRFTNNLGELKTNLPDSPNEHQLQVLEASEDKAIVVAIAKQDGIFSYTGAVYAQDASLPVSTICKSNEPTKTPPGTPTLKGATIICAQGSTLVE